MKSLFSAGVFILSLMSLPGCGNGGAINFTNQEPSVSVNKSSSFNYVPASQALVIQSGKTTTNGYHGKLQMNPLGGQLMSGPGGYKAQVKFTARSR